ncbi:hypothetical protein [Gluconobacter sp. GP1]|uniref:hypothetical protein n=1 Tax=Gluconobacter sp. GP1 TaxID=3046423 RepID=UPI00293E1150|nr:hypothetical protein [Gluconobacter sp. GP1]
MNNNVNKYTSNIPDREPRDFLNDSEIQHLVSKAKDTDITFQANDTEFMISCVNKFQLDSNDISDQNNTDALSIGYKYLLSFAAINKKDRKIYALYEVYSLADNSPVYLNKAIDVDKNFHCKGIGRAFLTEMRKNGIDAKTSGKYTKAGAALLNSLPPKPKIRSNIWKKTETYFYGMLAASKTALVISVVSGVTAGLCIAFNVESAKPWIERFIGIYTLPNGFGKYFYQFTPLLVFSGLISIFRVTILEFINHAIRVLIVGVLMGFLGSLTAFMSCELIIVIFMAHTPNTPSIGSVSAMLVLSLINIGVFDILCKEFIKK